MNRIIREYATGRLLILLCRLVSHNYHSYFSSFGRLMVLDPGDNASY